MKIKILVYFLLILLMPLPIQAESSVWKVSKADRHLFLGGTIHFLSEAEYPLPASYDQAYLQSGRIVLETDLRRLQSPEMTQQLLREVSYSDGRDIRQVLSASTYAALEQFFNARGIAMTQVVGFKPGMIAVTMSVLELQRLGLDGVGVDLYFQNRALQDGKRLGQLETVETQIEFIANMGRGQEDEMIVYSLEDTRRLPQLWQAILSAWREGDMGRLTEFGIKPIEDEFPQVYQDLLVSRNNAWMPRIEAMLQTREIEFVLVGALHLAGEDGLLRLLKTRGYALEQLR